MDKEKMFLEFKKIINQSFDYWEKHTLLVNLLFAILPVSMYFLGFLYNIRENTGSIITYASALVTLNGVFLTLLVTLKGSPIFVRLRSLFPKLHDYMYYGLKKQVMSCIFLILVNLAIAIVGPVENIIIISIGLVMWSYLIVDVSIGAIYNLKIVTDLAIKDVDTKKPMT